MSLIFIGKEENMFKNLSEKLNKVLKFSKESFKSSTIKGTNTKVEYGIEGAEAVTSGDGQNQPLADGEHELDNGEKITVAGGLVTKIENAPEEDKGEVLLESEDENAPEEVLAVEAPDGEIVPLDEAIEEGIVDIPVVEEEKLSEDKDSKITELEAKIAELEKQLNEKFSALPTKEDLEGFKKEFLNQLKTTPAQFSEVKVEEEPTNKWLAMARLKNKNN
ncbi:MULTISPECIES: hypothetical protein [Sphingobacterium]|uniref:hypothetical protein n=1 Tax=Sphingobacterium TaxID=28453 RepID=UPI0013DA4EA6|nr:MULTISPECIES: hypothetical protein [unclassified Sphingobacterium]